MKLNFTATYLILNLMVSLPHLFAGSSKETLLTRKEPFSRNHMEKSQSFSFLDPGRFSMSQSYSTSMMYSGSGSHSSGLYLNTVGYQISDPLILTMDFGLHSPFHTSGLYGDKTNPANFENGTSFVMPRIGLEYRPTEKTSFSLQFINVNDATKAYGPFGSHDSWRSPFFR